MTKYKQSGYEFRSQCRDSWSRFGVKHKAAIVGRDLEYQIKGSMDGFSQ